MKTYDREIITNLPNEKKYGEMIASVIGQLSDGAWENSNRCRGYWVFAECHSGKNNINVSQNWGGDYYWNCSNPYNKMSDEDIRHYFGRKIKELTLMELEDNYKREIDDEILGDLNRCLIPNDRYEEFLVKREKADAFLKEHPFNKRDKFTIDNNTELCYISYDERVTVADAYKAYKILMQ